jgi:hypothetical protein
VSVTYCQHDHLLEFRFVLQRIDTQKLTTRISVENSAVLHARIREQSALFCYIPKRMLVQIK